jgi:ubiquinone/menaquinone biosynthesis C-methylase UbiE
MKMALLLAATLGGPASAQMAEKANEHYQTPAGRERMLANLGAPDRAERLQGEVILQAVGVRPGMSVADLGTGGGAMLPLFSAAVGATGKVYAQDIFPDFIASSKEKNGRLGNVEWILGTPKDARLRAASVDLAVTIDAYHHYDYPAEMLASIKRALRPGGRFVIVDYFKRPDAMPGGNAVEHIRLDQDDVVKEVGAHGFRLVETREHVPGKQYIAIFTPVR